MIESHSIKERAYIFHIIDGKEIGREEREKHEESEEGKEEERQTETQGEKILSLGGLVIPAPPRPAQPWLVTCPL